MKHALARMLRALAAIIALLASCPAQTDAQSLLPSYQYRYGNFQDFLYHTNNAEGPSGGGWQYLGAIMSVYDSQAEGTVPLHRFYSPVNGKHFYTTAYDEVNLAEWNYEGVTGYIFSSARSGTNAIRRWFKWVDGGVEVSMRFYRASVAALIFTALYNDAFSSPGDALQGDAKVPWEEIALLSGFPRSLELRSETTEFRLTAVDRSGGLDLIRFGGHLLKGGYDVPNGGNEKPTAPSAVHG